MQAPEQSPEVRRLQAMLNQQSIEGAALNLRYTGLINMFSAACMVNNGRDMDNLREQIHGLVDNILDSNATTHMLTRQLIEAASRS